MRQHRPDAAELSTELAALLTLRRPDQPSARVPLPIRKLLPRPLDSDAEWRRFVFEDVAAMSPTQREREAFRLKIAAAQVDAEQLPVWITTRIARLEVSQPPKPSPRSTAARLVIA